MRKRELLPKHMYQCIAHFGNTVISERRHKELGEKAILEDLEAHGLHCKIKQYQHFEVDNVRTPHLSKQRSIVIEREKHD